MFVTKYAEQIHKFHKNLDLTHKTVVECLTVLLEYINCKLLLTNACIIQFFAYRINDYSYRTAQNFNEENL